MIHNFYKYPSQRQNTSFYHLTDNCVGTSSFFVLQWVNNFGYFFACHWFIKDIHIFSRVRCPKYVFDRILKRNVDFFVLFCFQTFLILFVFKPRWAATSADKNVYLKRAISWHMRGHEIFVVGLMRKCIFVKKLSIVFPDARKCFPDSVCGNNQSWFG